VWVNAFNRSFSFSRRSSAQTASAAAVSSDFLNAADLFPGLTGLGPGVLGGLPGSDDTVPRLFRHGNGGCHGAFGFDLQQQRSGFGAFGGNDGIHACLFCRFMLPVGRVDCRRGRFHRLLGTRQGQFRLTQPPGGNRYGLSTVRCSVREAGRSARYRILDRVAVKIDRKMKVRRFRPIIVR
jgi:hypothetical protein